MTRVAAGDHGRTDDRSDADDSWTGAGGAACFGYQAQVYALSEEGVLGIADAVEVRGAADEEGVVRDGHGGERWAFELIGGEVF